MMNLFTQREWEIIRDAVESEGFLLPEEQQDEYGIIIDKIETFLYARNNNES